MIQANIMGGLGNQLFQYATAYALARKFNTTLNLNTEWFKTNPYPYLNYCLDRFSNINCIHTEEQPASDIVTLNGYFQDPRLFDNYKPELLDIFTCAHEHLPCDTLAIHIRRGDHVNLNWQLPDSYYIDGIKALNPKYKPLIFTDDTQHCSRFNLPIYKSSGDNVLDMLTMGTADAFIISNSTYSWWAAYLSNKHEVIYPETIKNICNKHIIPAQWREKL